MQLYGFGDGQADAARVAAQIVAGVGAAGAGLYIVAAGAAVILIGVQCIFHIKCKVFQTKKFFQVKICFVSDGPANNTIKELFKTDRFNRLVIERKGGETVYHATLIQIRSIFRSVWARSWRSIRLSVPLNVATTYNHEKFE